MEYQNPQSQVPYQKPPTVIDGLIQPGIPPKVFSVLFFENCLVFVKSGSINPNTAGSMRASLGGYTGAGMIMGAVGSIVDHQTNQSRMEHVAGMASYSPGVIAQAHKNNFLLLYNVIEKVEMKGPNFAGEIRLSVYARGEKHKFRIDNQSKSSGSYVRQVLDSFLPGKVL
jgi:hypothetical protein